MYTLLPRRTASDLARSMINNPPMPSMKTPDRNPETLQKTEYFDDLPNFDDASEKPFLSFRNAFIIVLTAHFLVLGGFWTHGAVSKMLRQPQNVGVDHVAQDKKWLADSPPRAAEIAPSASEQKESVATPVPRKTVLAKSGASTPKVTAPPKEKPKGVVVDHPNPPAVDSAATPKWMEEAQSILAASKATPGKEDIQTRRATPVEPPVSRASEESPLVREALTSREYTLVSGDSLYAVARRLEVSYQELADINGIENPRALRVGQKLKVPASKLTAL